MLREKIMELYLNKPIKSIKDKNWEEGQTERWLSG